MVKTLGGPTARTLLEWTGLLSVVFATTAAIVWEDAGPGTGLRHLYLLPTVWAALRFGLAGGVAVSALAVFLDAPFLLGEIEAWGFDREAVEGVVTLGLLLIVGGLAGILADRAGRQRARYETVLALQRSLGTVAALRDGLDLTATALRRLLGAGRVEVMVRRDDGTHIGPDGPSELAAGSAGEWVLANGQSRHFLDVRGAPAPARPWRGFFFPLVAGQRVLGVAAAARATWFSGDDRAALETLGAQMALALENACLKDELEAKVTAATRRLGELDHAKSEFVATASHELRTPLTSLRGFTELLLTRRYDEQEARRFISVIHAEAERLGRILDNLLDLARIESGQRVELRRVPVDVRPLLEAQAEMFRAQRALRRFRVDAPADLPPLFIDRDAVDRILTNLVSNAVKYSPPGSEIRLLAATGDRERVEIAVEDDGFGIPADALPHIFDRYYRVPGRDGAARGLGLGLALVKTLVEWSGGAIHVDSEHGKGTRVTVALPRYCP